MTLIWIGIVSYIFSWMGLTSMYKMKEYRKISDWYGVDNTMNVIRFIPVVNTCVLVLSIIID